MLFNEYEIENGVASQYHFIKFFEIEMVLCNRIAEVFDLELQNPEVFDVDEETGDVLYFDVFQFFIIKERDVEYLKYLEEPIYYCNELDVYVLGFTNLGTSRDYILTRVPLTRTAEGLYYPDLNRFDGD